MKSYDVSSASTQQLEMYSNLLKRTNEILIYLEQIAVSRKLGSSSEEQTGSQQHMTTVMSVKNSQVQQALPGWKA